MKKVLIIGPFPKPISGVSLANKVVKDVLRKSNEYNVDKINTSYPVFEDAVGSFSIKKLIFFLKINCKAFKIVRKDIIYMTPGQTFFGVLKYASFTCLGSLLKKEMIIHVHGNYLGTQYGLLLGIKKRIFYFFISKFTKGIVLSDSLKSNLTPFLSPKKIVTLPNFAEKYLISDSPINANEIRIVYLSNLMEEKGILILLNALQVLEKKSIKYTAKVAGNIDHRLSKEIKEKLKTIENTNYIGIVEGKTKKELLEWGNIFVLPTYYKMEGQPISILEAMATKNVIITTKHAGISDIITEKINGFFVEKKDVESLASILIYLSEHKDEIARISECNKIHFLNNYTIETFEKNLLKILNN